MAKKNGLKTTAPICCSCCTIISLLLAFFLPFWVIWDGARIQEFPPIAALPNQGLTGSEIFSTFGLWCTRLELQQTGSVNCGGLGGNSCVCSPIDDALTLLRRKGRLVAPNGAFTPSCSESKLQRCETSPGLSSTLYASKLTASCEATFWWNTLRCGPEFQQDDDTFAPSLVSRSGCAANEDQECMEDWVTASRVLYVCAMVLGIILMIALWLTPRRRPKQVVSWTSLTLLVAVLFFFASLLALLAAVGAFRLACDHTWDRLFGEVWWGGAFYCALLSMLFVTFALFFTVGVWTQSRAVRDEYLYNYGPRGPAAGGCVVVAPNVEQQLGQSIRYEEEGSFLGYGADPSPTQGYYGETGQYYETDSYW